MIDEKLLFGLREGRADAFEQLVHIAVEEALKVLPGVMKSLMVQAAYVQKLNTSFFDDHRDLANHKDLVLQTLEKIEGSNPGTPYEKILEKTATEVRRIVQGVAVADTHPTGRPKLEELDHLAGMFEE